MMQVAMAGESKTQVVGVADMWLIQRNRNPQRLGNRHRILLYVRFKNSSARALLSFNTEQSVLKHSEEKLITTNV